MSKLYFIAFLMVFLVSWVFSEDTLVDPDSEEPSESLTEFLEALERYSGLTDPPGYKITGIVCDNGDPNLTECIVDPKGTIVWDLREKLYAQHMMQSVKKGGDNSTTIDGCLQYNANNLSGYRNCMVTVRNNMIAYLKAHFEIDFKETLRKNCSLAVENCYHASSS